MSSLQRISPCLWFDRQAEEAARFYVDIFEDASIGAITRYGKAGFDIHQMPEGTVMTIAFRLAGLDFLAMNGGPQFQFNEAISLQVHCNTQEEIDHYWGKLRKGGNPKAQQCGWLKDRFGLSWQIVPARLDELMRQGDRADAVMFALLGMKKIDLSVLERIHAG